MSKYSQIFYLSILGIIFFLLLSSAQVIASQTVPLPDKPTASYHPGLFGRVSSELESIPPVVNTYEGAEEGFLNTSPAVSYSFFPGNVEKGENPSIAGYISGTPLNNTSVNISGRVDKSEPFRYLTTIKPDNRGIFVWSLPGWASDITMFVIEIAR